jgi:hypothetical protein
LSGSSEKKLKKILKLIASYMDWQNKDVEFLKNIKIKEDADYYFEIEGYDD